MKTARRLVPRLALLALAGCGGDAAPEGDVLSSSVPRPLMEHFYRPYHPTTVELAGLELVPDDPRPDAFEVRWLHGPSLGALEPLDFPATRYAIRHPTTGDPTDAVHTQFELDGERGAVQVGPSCWEGGYRGARVLAGLAVVEEDGVRELAALFGYDQAGERGGSSSLNAPLRAALPDEFADATLPLSGRGTMGWDAVPAADGRGPGKRWRGTLTRRDGAGETLWHYLSIEVRTAPVGTE